MRFCFAMVVAALATLALVPAAQAGGVINVGSLGTTPADAQFAQGTPQDPDNTILVHLDNLIRAATPGSNILATVHDIAPGGRIDDALQYAQGQGVNVWVIYDEMDGGQGSGSGPFQWLPQSRLKHCDLGCLSANDPAGTTNDSIMHIKTFIFSSTKRPGGTTSMPVVWIGSANADANTGTNAFNDGITWYGDGELYNRVWDVLKDMWNGPYGANFDYLTWPNDNPRTIGNGVFNAPASKTWGLVSPDQGDPAHVNLWARQLALIKAPSEGGTSPCDVRVMQNYVNDVETSAEGTPQIGSELRRLARGGCAVRIIVNRTDDGAIQMGPVTRQMLCSEPNVTMKSVNKLHDKAVIVRGHFWGTPNTYTVFTGSHNMTRDALVANDELIVRVDGSSGLLNAYNNHFAVGTLAGTSFGC